MRNEKNNCSFDEGMKIIDGVSAPVNCLISHLQRDEGSDSCDIRLHYHNYIEMIYVLEGKVIGFDFDESFNLEKGDLVIVNSREPHAFSTACKGAQYMVIQFTPEIIYATDSSIAVKYIIPFTLESNKKRVYKADEIGDVRGLVKEIYNEWTDKKHGYDLIVRANIITIYTKVLRSVKNCGQEDAQITYEVYSAIEKALEYATKEYRTANAKTAAEVCNLSYSYFSRSFKKVIKRTFSEYVNYIRLIEAERMMFSTDKSITEIAAETGFSTTSHFIKRFREYKNISPKQFRLNMGK